jgi:hypothetical protein
LPAGRHSRRTRQGQESQCESGGDVLNEKELNQAFSRLSSAVFRHNEQLMDQEPKSSTRDERKGINYALAVNKAGQNRRRSSTEIALSSLRHGTKRCDKRNPPNIDLYIGQLLGRI